GAVTVRAARNASRPRATVPGTKPPGIRAREGHLQSATHSPVTYGPYVTQNEGGSTHEYQERVTSRRSAASRAGVPSSSVPRAPRLSPARPAADCGSTWRRTAPGGRTL